VGGPLSAQAHTTYGVGGPGRAQDIVSRKKYTQIKKVIHSDIYATYMWWVGPQRTQDMSIKKKSYPQKKIN